MLRQKPIGYGVAALTGFVLGAIFFLIVHSWVPGDLEGQVVSFLVATAGGVLIASAVAFCWNVALRRAHRRHDQDRGIALAREADG